jgi:5-methylcytosine-specific restriction enzyme B
MILDEKLSQELRELNRKLFSEGKLSSEELITTYYNTFRNRFGPDILKNIDGEALLETMHGQGKDKLPYWLEFKHDDEFPTKQFGSISGGSAYKFGIFRRKETGTWTGGSPMNPKELSLEEAIEIARKNRNQIIEGCKILDSLPMNGTDEDYKYLQKSMDELAPDISRVAWGHKYFSLLYPNKLNALHAQGVPQYFLIKLLQQNLQSGGRYIADGRFVAIANELGISPLDLVSILYTRYGYIRSYWCVGTSSDGVTPRNRWDLMREGNFVAIGWPNLGDLSVVIGNKDGKEIIQRAMEVHYPNTPAAIGKLTKQIFMFVSGDSGMFGPGTFNGDVVKGDIVLASDGAKVLGIGELTGDYFFDPSSDFPHRRRVNWLSLEEWKQPDVEGLNTTVHHMRKEANLIETERRILYASAPPIETERRILHAPAPQSIINPNLESQIGILPKPITPLLQGWPGRIQAVLERKRQVILYGPPGTGKTYWAEYSAYELAAYSIFGSTFDQLTTEQRSYILGEDGVSRGIVRMCCFHPAYGYEDFLEGFRPESVNGQMQFTERDGIFKRLCLDAKARSDEKFYLIIDEVNRGDIPRIFGELLTILEKNKRGKPILLPLTGELFSVPDNVYIIGTMNTADRSIALLDTALRRRFGFIELMPDSKVLGNAVVEGIPLGAWLDALNSRICEHVGRDARNLQIGHSYLLDKGSPIADFAHLSRAVQEDILPLLEEYCYEDYGKLEKILGTDLVDVRNQQIRHELFVPSNWNELVLALLAPCPEITTSIQAIDYDAKTSAEDNSETIDDEAG